LSGQAGRSVNKQLIAQTKALSRFTLGLMYDLGGFSEDALGVFQQAIEELDWEQSGGEAVFYYFMGRSALFLNQDEAAQTAFEKAKASETHYARPYIGLGSVYNRRAQCRLLSTAGQNEETNPGYKEICLRQDGELIAPCQSATETCLDLVQQDAQQAAENYQKAITFADETLEPQTKVIGRLGLGTNYRIQGELHIFRHDDEKADALFEQAIKEIQAILEPMEAAGQHRYVGQAYLALGTAYTQQALIRQRRGDEADSITLFKKARQAYADCIAQKEKSPLDKTLTQKIIAASCEPYDKISADALAALEGGQ
jgi:tetratricopeptide (TPR) repeat protein